MKFQTPIDVLTLTKKYDLEMLDGITDDTIQGVNEIHSVEVGDITFVDTLKYYDKVLHSAASFVIINTREITNPLNKCLLYAENPFLVYNQISQDYFPTDHSDKSMIASNAHIGQYTRIYPNVFIGNNVTIGNNCIIYPNVSIYPNTIIGDNVIIHSNTTIGSDAFYYNKQNGQYLKMHTIGYVVIEDDVEIGSQCSIDACESDVTRIGKGTKLDNQIHIAHGVQIGSHSLLCAQVAIAGKTKIGNNVTLYGKVGVSKGLKIGDNAIILASSNVDKDLEGNQRYYGSPAIEARQAMKHYASMRMLPEVLNKLKHILYSEKTVES